MYVHGFAVEAFISTVLGADEAVALVAPTDPASRASVDEVDHQVGVYVRGIMNDLINRHELRNLGDVYDISYVSDVSCVQFGGLLNGIAHELKLTGYVEVVGEFVFRKTNRIHTPLDEAAFNAYSKRLISRATMEYHDLSSNYPLPPEGHKLEAIGIIFGALLSAGHAFATADQQSALALIKQRGQRFRDVALQNIHRRERVALAPDLAENDMESLEYRSFLGRDEESRHCVFSCYEISEVQQRGRTMPPWAFLSQFSNWQELRNVQIGYENALNQCGEWEYAFNPGDADLFGLGETRWVTPLTMKVGVAWTVDVKQYVASGRWYFVPLLVIEHDFRCTGALKDVCDRREFAGLVADLYQRQLRENSEYEDERNTWSEEENVGYGQVESDDSDPGSWGDWVPAPDVPEFYESDVEFFNV